MKKAVSKEQNEEKVKDEMRRKVFLAQISNKLTECKPELNSVDIYNYFIKYDKIETLKLHRKGGYGFLTFKTRMGPIQVFEAGDFHNIKGFKVAVCSYQIESRNVIEKDKLKDITHVEPKKQKNTLSTLAAITGDSMELLDEDSLAETTRKMASFQQASFASGKGSHMNSTMNTKAAPGHKIHNKKNEDSLYDGDSLFSNSNMPNEDWKSGNEELLAEVMNEIQLIELNKMGPKKPVMAPNSYKRSEQMAPCFNQQPWNGYGPGQDGFSHCNNTHNRVGYHNQDQYGYEYYPEDSNYYESDNYASQQGQAYPEQWTQGPANATFKPVYKPSQEARGFGNRYSNMQGSHYGQFQNELTSTNPSANCYHPFQRNMGKQVKQPSIKPNQWLQHIDAEEAPALLWAEEDGEEEVAPKDSN